MSSMAGHKRKRTSSASNNAATSDAQPHQPHVNATNGEESAQQEQVGEPRKRIQEDKNEYKVHLLGANRKPPKKKRLQDVTEPQLEGGIPGSDGQLDTQFMVSPGKSWDSLSKYRYFVLKPSNIEAPAISPAISHKFGIGEFVFVNHSIDDASDKESEIGGDGTAPATFKNNGQSHSSSLDERQDWVAWIREVRALDPENVFLRVVWMYWPEELPHGKEAHHGKRELVASNFIDIIDAMTVEGRANVQHFVHSNRKGAQKANMSDFGNLDPHTYYWRQIYNVLEPVKLSSLPKDCICKRITNLDERLFQCPHLDCQRWWHETCLANAALRQYWTEHYQQATYSTTATEINPAENKQEQGANGITNGEADGDTIFAVPKSNTAAGSLFGAVKNLLTRNRNGVDVEANGGANSTDPHNTQARSKKTLGGRFKSKRGHKSQGNKAGLAEQENPWGDRLVAQLDVVDGVFTGLARIYQRQSNSDHAENAETADGVNGGAPDGSGEELLDTVEVKCLHDKCRRTMLSETVAGKVLDPAEVDGTDAAIDPLLMSNGQKPSDWGLSHQFGPPGRPGPYAPVTEEFV